MKLFALTVLGVTCCLVGQYIAYTLNMRSKLLEKLQVMLCMTESEIEYLCRPASEIISLLASKKELSDLKFINECNLMMQGGTNFKDAWDSSLSKKANVRFLKKEDISVLLSFGEMFGITDSSGQISNCKMHSQLIKDKLNDAREMKNRYASLSSSMGIVTGIGLIIIFI